MTKAKGFLVFFIVAQLIGLAIVYRHDIGEYFEPKSKIISANAGPFQDGWRKLSVPERAKIVATNLVEGKNKVEGQSKARIEERIESFAKTLVERYGGDVIDTEVSEGYRDSYEIQCDPDSNLRLTSHACELFRIRYGYRK